MNPDFIFDSAEKSEKKFSLASGYVSTTVILFKNENIFAKIEAEGKIELYNGSDEKIGELSAMDFAGGKDKYEDILCSVNDGKIVFRFPVYRWIDNYPHCDGENDRWDCVITGYSDLLVFEI